MRTKPLTSIVSKRQCFPGHLVPPPPAVEGSIARLRTRLRIAAASIAFSFRNCLQRAPEAPKIKKKSRFRARLKISSENEIFECATHRGPIFCGEFDTLRLKFSSETKIPIEIEIFNLESRD